MYLTTAINFSEETEEKEMQLQCALTRHEVCNTNNKSAILFLILEISFSFLTKFSGKVNDDIIVQLGIIFMGSLKSLGLKRPLFEYPTKFMCSCKVAQRKSLYPSAFFYKGPKRKLQI